MIDCSINADIWWPTAHRKLARDMPICNNVEDIRLASPSKSHNTCAEVCQLQSLSHFKCHCLTKNAMKVHELNAVTKSKLLYEVSNRFVSIEWLDF